MKFKVFFTNTASVMLNQIKDKRIKQAILDKTKKLATNPDKQGKPLKYELADYRSLKIAGNRYRLIYQIEKQAVIVIAVGLRKEGSKKDIYKLAKRIIETYDSIKPPEKL